MLTNQALWKTRFKSIWVGIFLAENFCRGLLKHISRRSVSMTAIAIAWIIAKGCCLIVGLANESQLDGLLEALIVTLSEGDIKRLGEECEPLGVTGGDLLD